MTMHSEGRLDGVSESAILLHLFHPSMVDDPNTNVAPLLQLAAAIMLDKPLLLVVRPADLARMPEHLRRVADRVVVVDMDDVGEAGVNPITAAIGELLAGPRAMPPVICSECCADVATGGHATTCSLQAAAPTEGA